MSSINKSLLLISIILLSFLIDNLNAGTCCEGDKICSGCWMCEGSNLRSCWDRATPMPSKCEAITDLQQKAACYCTAYAAIAKCWGAGTCCTEYAPTLAAATDLCNLQTYPSDLIAEWQLIAAVKEAARVADAIWHNDSGVDIPKCESHIKPYTGGAVATGTAKAALPSYGSYKPIDSPPPPQSSEQNYTPPSKPKDDGYTKPKDNYTKPGHYKHYDASAHKYNKKPSYRPKESEQKKDDGKDDNCDSKHQYTKRASYTSLDMSAGELHAARLAKRSITCGISFNGVGYPLTVPETVQKAYDQI
eukprot:GHVU01014116.1.p1 GENE.GHVU01014116.1~~GHVU01014116.1.p1  ORF type:complete len:304 (+),score=19.92 GHVU01014116.1:224-1135(+)